MNVIIHAVNASRRMQEYGYTCQENCYETIHFEYDKANDIQHKLRLGLSGYDPGAHLHSVYQSEF